MLHTNSRASPIKHSTTHRFQEDTNESAPDAARTSEGVTDQTCTSGVLARGGRNNHEILGVASNNILAGGGGGGMTCAGVSTLEWSSTATQ
jgi:hypothetical protein